jgi:hypothetical protein
MIYSIPLTMTRDLLIRARLGLLVCIGGTVAVPFLLICVLKKHGVEADDSAMRRLAYIFMSFNALCAFSMNDGAKFRRGLYSLPITTAVLVASQMIPAMLFAGLLTFACTALENIVFHQQYPVWSPALFAGASFGACWATYWYTKDSAWQTFILSIVAGSLICWYASRFVPYITPVERIVELPAHEIVGLVLLAIASCLVTIAGVTRDRCGDHFRAGNAFDRNVASFDFVFQRNTPTRFRNSLDAQRWYQWSRKGWVMPFCSFAGIVLFLCLWLIFDRKPTSLVSCFVHIGGFLQSIFGGLISGLLGGYCINWNLISGDEPKDLSHFVHSRPITNADIARSQLYLVARSVVTSWSIWAACFLLVSVILFVTGTAPKPFFPWFVRWWYFPATFLGLWAAAASIHVVVMTGDEKRLPQVVGCFVGAMLLHFFLTEWLLSEEAKTQLFRVVVSILGIGLILGSAGLFATARQRGLITTLPVVACLSVWFGLAAVIIFEKLRHPTESTAIYLFMIALASLVVAPFAAAPLAVSHNRTR